MTDKHFIQQNDLLFSVKQRNTKIYKSKIAKNEFKNKNAT